jgi:hypothetical protein
VQIQQLRNHNPVASLSLQNNDLPKADEGWEAALAATPEAESAIDPARPSRAAQDTVAEEKLTQLLMTQTLRDVLPKTGSHGGSLALDTWRGLLADIVAEKVSEAMPSIVKVSSLDAG